MNLARKSILVVCFVLVFRTAFAVDGRIDAMDQWVLEQSPHHYTVQAFASNDKASARSFIARNDLAESMHMFRVHDGKSTLYKAVYRSYESRSDAEQGKRELQQRFPENGFWIRKFSDIVNEIQGRKPNQTTLAATSSGSTTKFSFTDEEDFRRGQKAFNKQDYKLAMHYWRPLADDGMPEAQYGLGFLYESGWGVARDYGQAYLWHAKAADNGHAKAQFNLGVLYSLGLGVDKDPVIGRYWIDVSANNQDQRALDYITANEHRTD